jgi:adenosylcobinamide-GDP ribazoletransferase
MQALRHFLLAVQYFTRIPLPARLVQWIGYTDMLQAASIRHFPAVGAVLGVYGSSVLCGFVHVLPTVPAAQWVAVLLACCAMMHATGALHEDGLADVSDGLGGSADRERALIIMKDSRIGSFGALALVCAVLLKVALLVALLQVSLNWAVWGLLLGQVCSRWTPLWIAALLPNARSPENSKSSFASQASPWVNVLVGTVWVLAVLCLGIWVLSVQVVAFSMLGLIVPSVWMFRVLKRRLQGFTGDALGATQQLSELGFYLGLLCASAGWVTA